MGFSLFANLYRCIFFVEDNHGFINTYDPSRTEQFGHTPVESVDEVALVEESISVLGDISFFLIWVQYPILSNLFNVNIQTR